MTFDVNINTILTTGVAGGVVWIIKTLQKLDRASAADVVWKDMHAAQDDENFREVRLDIKEVREEQERLHHVA